MDILVAKFVAAASAETVETFLACTGGRGFTTRPTDTPPNKECPPFLMNGGSYDREMFSGNRTLGEARPAHGSMTLLNSGYYDGFRNYGFSERAFTLYIGPEGGAFPADFEVVFTAIMVAATFSLKTVSITLKDRLYLLDEPFCPNFYSGSGGINGDSSSKGKRRPRGYGRPWHYAPTLVDSTRLIYQCNDQAMDPVASLIGMPKIWDGGVPITGAIPDSTDEYTNVADMLANAPSPGAYRKYSPGGYFRLGSEPEYGVRTNTYLTGGGNYETIADILEKIAADHGITANAGDVAAVNTAQTARIGYWNEGNTDSALTVMGQIASSGGVWFGFDRLGELRMALFEAPSGDPVYTINEWNLLSIERRPPQGSPVPAYSVDVVGFKNWSGLSSLATSVTASDRVLMSTTGQLEGSNYTSVAVRDKHLGAEMMQVTTVLQQGYTAAETTRNFSLYGVDRDLIVVSLQLTRELFDIDLNSVVELKISRLGFQAGKLFRVIAVRLNLGATPKVELSLWG